MCLLETSSCVKSHLLEAFVLTEEIFPVEITEDGQTIEITIENQIIKGTAETIKVDADYPDHKLSGADF